jgi:hypothetical protein
VSRHVLGLVEHMVDRVLIVAESRLRLMALVLVACIIDEVFSILFKNLETKSI